ncbi:MAG: hypothetical protein IH623_04075 [Verrucomicrobia bacterium]|nr:hypothetical protein [Verrucomicrobiota bacterium]
MHNIENDLIKQVQSKVAAPVLDRLADAVDLMIPPADGSALVPGDFIPHARLRPVMSLVPSIKLITERASTTTQVLYAIHERYYAHSHWGLNE